LICASQHPVAGMGNQHRNRSGSAEAGTSKVRNYQPQVFMVSGVVYIVVFGGLLLARLPSGPIIPVLNILVGSVSLIGGSIAYFRRRPKGYELGDGPSAPANARWHLPHKRLIGLMVIAIVSGGLALPAALDGQPVGYVEVALAGLVTLVAGTMLLRRTRSDGPARERQRPASDG
jgi:hypothetical protein